MSLLAFSSWNTILAIVSNFFYSKNNITEHYDVDLTCFFKSSPYVKQSESQSACVWGAICGIHRLFFSLAVASTNLCAFFYSSPYSPPFPQQWPIFLLQLYNLNEDSWTCYSWDILYLILVMWCKRSKLSNFVVPETTPWLYSKFNYLILRSVWTWYHFCQILV